MAGYWPNLSFFFFCVFVGRDEETKKNDANLYVAESKRQIPSGQDGPFLPAWVANQNTVFSSSCSLG